MTGRNREVSEHRWLGALALLVLISCQATPEIDEQGDQLYVRSENGGIVLELQLDRRQVHVGDVVSAVVRLSNQGQIAVLRETNTCGAGPAPAFIVPQGDADPAAGMGREWQGIAAEFKRAVLAEAALGVGRGAFWQPGPDGNPVGCDLMSVVRPFLPGESEQMGVIWRAVPDESGALFTGPAVVRATFESQAPPGGGAVVKVSAELPIEIMRRDPDDEPVGPTLADYIDSALGHEPFMAWLEAAPPETWINPHVIYWPTPEGSYPEFPPFNTFGRRPIVEIGLSRLKPPEDLRLVIIDRATAEVLAMRSE